MDGLPTEKFTQHWLFYFQIARISDYYEISVMIVLLNIIFDDIGIWLLGCRIFV